MQRKILKRMGMIVAVALSVLMASPVAADSDNILERLESTETDADFAEDISYNRMRGNNLNYGESRISKLSSHEVNIYGLTQCHRTCETVYLTMGLEWKVDGSYGTYKIWDLSTSNATSFSRSYNVIVPSGHYYRLRGYHAAYNGGLKESVSTLTSGILVN